MRGECTAWCPLSWVSHAYSQEIHGQPEAQSLDSLWLSVISVATGKHEYTLIIMLYLVIRRYVAKGNKVILFKNLLAWLSLLFIYLFFFLIKPFKCVRTHICTLTPVNEYWADLPIVHISGWTGTATQGVNPICHYPVQAATLDQVSMLFQHLDFSNNLHLAFLLPSSATLTHTRFSIRS